MDRTKFITKEIAKENALVRLTQLEESISNLSRLIQLAQGAQTAWNTRENAYKEQMAKKVEYHGILQAEVKEQLHIPLVINWVAVEDELPSHQTDVMTYSKEFEVRNGRCMQKGTWFVDGYSKRVDVTHWAELPKPPCL